MMRMSSHMAGLHRRCRSVAMVLAVALASAATPSGAQAQARADACEESRGDSPLVDLGAWTRWEDGRSHVPSRRPVPRLCSRSSNPTSA